MITRRKSKIWRSFCDHRSGAKRRSIPFLLSFDEWLQIWLDSGHLHERGYHKGQYCMARFGDKGPYAVGNVKIITCSENHIESNKSHLGGHLGRAHTPETRAKISKSIKATIAREGPSRLGKKHTPESLSRMSEAQRKRRSKLRQIEDGPPQT